MKKLKLAIIGQGRSGKDIHGKFYISEANTLFDVCCVVDEDEHRRNVSAARYPGAEILSDYRDLFGKNIDVVVNATYSCEHYAITRDLIEHGFNVLVWKSRSRVPATNASLSSVWQKSAASCWRSSNRRFTRPFTATY